MSDAGSDDFDAIVRAAASPGGASTVVPAAGDTAWDAASAAAGDSDD